MKFCSLRLGSARSLLALPVSLAVVLSTNTFSFASPARSNTAQKQNESAQNELRLTSATATATTEGVVLEWRTTVAPDNLGFNIYRLKNGQRTRVNRYIVPGSILFSGEPAGLRSGYSYAWVDRGGTSDSVYYIESVSVQGTSRIHEAISPVARKTVPGFAQAPEADNVAGSTASQTERTDSFEKYYPAAEGQLNSLAGAIEDQWAIAALPGLKIAIKKDGWYRITQPQMAAAGFSPPDIRNLRLFVDAQEVAIATSQSRGPLGSGDYIEFYGQGLDVPTTDTRTYYLIADLVPGKRVRGELQPDSSGPLPPPAAPGSPTPQTPAAPKLAWFGLIWRFLNIAEEPRRSVDAPAIDTPVKIEEPDGITSGETPPNNSRAIANPARVKKEPGPAPSLANSQSSANASLAEKPSDVALAGSQARGRKTIRKKRKKLRKQNHVVSSLASAPSSFDNTVERKDRLVYFLNVLNGDQENFFGQVLSANPTTQTINAPNPEPAAAGPAHLEIALQGVNLVTHQVNVELNNVMVGSFSYFGVEHPVQVFDVPVSQLLNGTNTLRFVPVSGSGVSIVDYAKLTYPHSFLADAGSLKFSLRGTQSVKVDGFSTPSVRLIDYTDPFNVKITKPSVETSSSGYEITVPVSSPRSKETHLLYALPDGQADPPAGLSLNQPSQWNSAANAADFLIVSHKNLIPSVAPLVTARQGQGLSVATVDVEDIYDEFSFGVHGPQAIKDFLRHAATHWATPPRYVVFVGDASLDPRNYQGAAPAGSSFDLVPTKLVDATYNETASDDWLTDFDNDGIADIPVGRLPVRTVAEASLVISKIVNFSPANVPQNALLVADDPTGYYFNFEQANDAVQALIPGLGVEKVYRRIDASSSWTVNCQNTGGVDCTPHGHLVAKFNEGQALANYSGHGNVDVWTGASIFTSSDATELTNGKKLSFVVVMDCLNGYYQDPTLLSLSEAFIKAPGGGAVAAFASSGLTLPDGQHEMSAQLYTLIYGAGSTPIALGDAIKIAKGATTDIDVRRTWIFFGDPSMKIR